MKKKESAVESAYLLMHEVESYLRIVGSLSGASAEKCAELSEKVERARNIYHGAIMAVREAVA